MLAECGVESKPLSEKALVVMTAELELEWFHCQGLAGKP